MENPERDREKLRLSVWVFALVMLGVFAVFLAAVPVRTGTTQIFRLRYYALQDGLEGGPLSSSLGSFDWRKAFVWRASDTEYRQRQFSQFFEVLTPRLYGHLYYRFGPFMWYPFSLACVFAIGFMIALAVRQWTGGWLPGIVAGSFWLLTTEVLVGHHAPVRYAKDLATLQILGIVSLLLAMRGAGRGRRGMLLAAIGVIWWLGLFTDEYIPFIFPALAAAVFTWPWLKPVRFRLLFIFLLLLAAGFLLFWFVLPGLITPDQKEPLAKIAVGEMPSPAEKIVHNLRYLVLNSRDVLTYTFGWPPPHSPAQTVLAALAGLALILVAIFHRAWRGWGRMIVFWLIALVAAGGVLLPEGNDILHQHTYYNRPLVALMLVVLGLFTANIFRRGSARAAAAWLALLAAVGGLNAAVLAPAIVNDPEEAYLTRYGLEDVLQMHHRLKSGELAAPVLLSYPQFRDAADGVYRELEYLPGHTIDDGDPPWSLFRSLVPRLYIRHFEEGALRADPRQFARWRDADEHLYRAGANSLYDMPAGTVWDLAAIRGSVIPPAAGPEWESADGRRRRSVETVDLLGEAPFTRLGRGEWRLLIEAPTGGESRLTALIALRHDGPAELRVVSGGTTFDLDCDYAWSWRLFAAGLEAGSAGAEFILKIGGKPR